jgi:cystathionine gamma-synthase/cystathionine gamma-lyase
MGSPLKKRPARRGRAGRSFDLLGSGERESPGPAAAPPAARRGAGFATRAIHDGQPPDPSTGAVNVGIFYSSTFAQRPGVKPPFEYARTGNPTRQSLERCIASLESARFGLCFSSGMGAETTLLSLLKSGDHVVCSDDVYGGTYRLFERFASRFGVEATYVDSTNAARIEDAMRRGTRLVWVETPTNPLLKITDLRAAARIARHHGALTVVDNTFASPCLQRPLELGCDIVVHSATKYLGGHSDVVLGALALNDPEVHETLKFFQNALGAVPSPMDCFLTLRGIKTLDVRMERHCRNARRIAEWLVQQEGVKRVLYPGLESHPGREIAKAQMRDFGGMISFELAGAKEALGVLGKVGVFTMGESLGGVESLIEHPASMTHASVPREVREARGFTDGLVRVSVGIEDVDDLIADLEQAMR